MKVGTLLTMQPIFEEQQKILLGGNLLEFVPWLLSQPNGFEPQVQYRYLSEADLSAPDM
jgi:hypothetical protein